MALLTQPGAEPIAGYQLVERLGTGGYGEVWKATAPGGITKAIKIVYGHMQDARAEQELKALGRIKEVRHPFLLSLERFEFIDNQLVIVMELADKSLMDRFQECQKSGLPGVPRNELLAYLLDASDALDYMGKEYGLQHLDIKPQNLLLVGGRVKLADFGLVKDLQGSSASATGGITPIYATPEAFDGKVSRYSDQYSLAVVYQEMLTGCRPFTGTTALQLAAQHTKCPPVLDSLSLPDRPTIARALSKVPEQRFPTCREMVEDLLRASGSLAVTPKAPTSGVRLVPTPQAAPKAPHLAAGEEGAPNGAAGVHAQLVQPPAASPPPPDLAADGESLLNEATLVSEQLSPELMPKPPAAEAFGEHEGRPLTPKSVGAATLRPTLFLGVGGVAGWALRRLKQRLHHRYGNLAAMPIVRLLLLDTDRSALRQARQGEGGEALDSGETLLVPLRRPEHYRSQSKKLLRWLSRRWLYNIPRSLLTEGGRPLGRLALVDNAADVLCRLRETIAALGSGRAKTATVAATGQGLRDENPQVFIVASIAGGTGGGMLLDLAYAVRQILAEFQLPTSICGILVHATSQRPTEEELARLNAYATLKELQHYSSADTPYPGDPEHGLTAFGPATAPFQDTYIVHLGDRLDRASAEAATDPLAEYLYLSATTALGELFDRWRQSTHAAAYGQAGDSRLRLFGLYRFGFPRQRLATLAADVFCTRVVERWCDQPANRDEEHTEKEALVQISALGLDAESLDSQFQAAAVRVFGESPEQSFLKVLADYPLNQTPPPVQPSLLELTELALGKIDGFLGPGSDSDTGKRPVATPVDVELGNKAKELAVQLSRSVIEWLLTIVEDPKRRLPAAYHAAKWSLQHVAASANSVRARLTQLRNHRATIRNRLAAGDFGGKGSGFLWLWGARRQGARVSPKQKLVEYCWLRLNECVLENTLDVFESVASRVAGFVQDLQSGKEKLREFGRTLTPMSFPVQGMLDSPLSLPCMTELLPGQSASLTEAAKSVYQGVEPKLSESFHETFQAEVLNRQGGLWGLVSGTGELVQRAKEGLQSRALAAIVAAIRDIDAAKLFLESRGEPDKAHADLLAYLASVAPNPKVPKGWQHLMLALPTGPAGVTLRQLLSQALAEMPNTMLDSEDDIVLCHEVAHLPLQQMAELLIGAAAYADAASPVMTRGDIAWSALALSPSKNLR